MALTPEEETELSNLEVAFEAAGGRGVEMAERINELRSKRDGYTTAPEFIRLHDEGDGWVIDGATNDGLYTEEVWKFDTLEEAATQVPGFIRYIRAEGYTIGE